jgi:hypothetical protein
MEDKQVILQRKQSTQFVVNYPFGQDSKVKEYIWSGTLGKTVNERPVPYEVFEWLKNSTTTFQDGSLVIKSTEDEDVLYAKESIENIEDIEKAVMTKEEVIAILEKGNHLSLKKALKEITQDKPESFVSRITRYICGIASDVGIDSSAKRKVLSEWAGIDFEKSELIFDKNIDELYEKASK